MAVIKTMKKVVKEVSQDLKAMKVGKARASKKVSKKVSKTVSKKKKVPKCLIGVGKHKGFVNVGGRWLKLPKGMKPSQAFRIKMIHVPMTDLKGVWVPHTEIECANWVNPKVFSEDSQKIRIQAAWNDSGDIVWVPADNWKNTRKVSSLSKSEAKKFLQSKVA